MPGRSVTLVQVAAAVLALAAGLLVGTLGSFKYRSGLTAATPSPIGLVLVIVMIALVLAAIRVASGRRLYGVAAGIGIIAAVALFALKGPGGSVVVPSGTDGTIWTVAPVLIAAVVLGVPAPRRRAAQRSGLPRRGSERNGPQRADGILDAPPEGAPPE